MCMVVLLAFFFFPWNIMSYFLYVANEYMEGINSEVEVNCSKIR